MNRVLKTFCIRYAILVMILLLNEQVFCQRLEILPDVQYLYSRGGGQDVYKEGDRYGFEIHVLFSGEYRLYSDYYKSEYILDRTGHITEDQRDSLKFHFENLDFLNFPNHLPLTNKQRWPLSTCGLGFRVTESDSIKLVYANLTADEKYYPKGFFKFISKVRSILFENIKDK